MQQKAQYFIRQGKNNLKKIDAYLMVSAGISRIACDCNLHSSQVILHRLFPNSSTFAQMDRTTLCIKLHQHLQKSASEAYDQYKTHQLAQEQYPISFDEYSKRKITQWLRTNYQSLIKTTEK